MNIRAILPALVLAVLSACTPAQLQTVRDASEARAQLCVAVETVAKAVPAAAPDLAKAREACARGDDAEKIAAALARCEEPAQ